VRYKFHTRRFCAIVSKKRNLFFNHLFNSREENNKFHTAAVFVAILSKYRKEKTPRALTFYNMYIFLCEQRKRLRFLRNKYYIFALFVFFCRAYNIHMRIKPLDFFSSFRLCQKLVCLYYAANALCWICVVYTCFAGHRSITAAIAIARDTRWTNQCGNLSAFIHRVNI